jgi:hypothetical protein
MRAPWLWLRFLFDEVLDAVFTWALYRDVKKGPRRPPPRTRGDA